MLSDGLTDDQKRQQLNDLQTRQKDLVVLQHGGYITDDIQPQLNDYQAQIDQLTKELAATGIVNSAAAGAIAGAQAGRRGLDDEAQEEYPAPQPGPTPAPMPEPTTTPGTIMEPGPQPTPVPQSSDDIYSSVGNVAAPLNSPDNQAKYDAEIQQRFDALKYQPSEDFSWIVNKGLGDAQSNLNTAKANGDNAKIAQYQQEVDMYTAIEGMFKSAGDASIFGYGTMEQGLQAVQSLMGVYQDDMNHASNDYEYRMARENLAYIQDELVSINRGMNVVGEAYLDEIDQRRKDNKISPEDGILEYEDYYKSVIERESLIDVESTLLKADNLTMANASTIYDLTLQDTLEALDIPLYSTEEDAVFAFKKEAMPLTLDNGKEYSAILDAIEVLDTDTGKVSTYYYYFEAKQGADTNVVFNALLGAGNDKDRKLLHTHPVTGGANRHFSGDPENHGLINKYLFDSDPQTLAGLSGEMGDSSVPELLGYGGIYVITSGAEVKLYEGFGPSDTGSGQSTHGDTKDEMNYVSTIDVY